MASSTYDFIVVGAGASGCTVASHLAKSKGRPSVLLVEAGGDNSNLNWRIDSDRWVHRFDPELAWGYSTIPQHELNHRIIGYDRGKGLGGSTATNFSTWNIGPRDDHEEIARITGDSAWKWDHAHELYKAIESYHGRVPDVPEGLDKYLKPNPDAHGKDGPIKVGFPRVWEKDLTNLVDAWEASGYHINRDLGSDGNPLGISISPHSAHNATRSTAADILVGAPTNLTVATNAFVHRIILDGKTAVGVTLVDGKEYRASKEVIISAGALDTPKILMLSGIGPENQLQKFNIPIVHANPNIGQNLRDHCHATPTWIRKEYTSLRPAYFKNPTLREAALKQWQEDKTGPLADIHTSFAIAFFKSQAVLKSAEFEALPAAEKSLIQAPTVPSYEIIVGGPSGESFMDPVNTPALATIFIFLMNTQSRGNVTLQSSDPKDPLLYDPKFLSHPYDKRVAIEATREVMQVVESPAFQKDSVGVLHAPKTNSEEDILSYWRDDCASTWHMAGTCKIGQREVEDQACVDPEFKVFGVDNLRVVDMSIVPIMPNNHTQTTAFLIGMIGSEKLIQEYGLDS